ncbi:MAG TPA: HAMP domain-containing protein, partial [Verrucomicrobiae bacterium]|nr:HAMP domain-containing protein [Verrucomicrobiae bacterium]
MFRSIKWRLQLWHAVILLLVLAGFGYTAFELQRTREFRRVDQELHEHMAALIGPLRRPGRAGAPPRGPFPPPDRGGPLGNNDFQPGWPQRGRPPGGPPEFQRDPDAFFPEGGLFYYGVWDREGHLVRSRGTPDRLPPLGQTDRGGIRSRAEFRELLQRTPRGESLVVGRSIAAERAELRKLALLLLGSGAMILTLGLAGGWWVASRAMRPIENISDTAQKIATGDLTHRIAHQETGSELGRLAVVLNS